MKRTMMLTGDVNLMNVTDPRVPFALIGDTLRRADVLFGNLECCFYEPSRQCLSRMASSIWRARGASLSVQRARSVGARSASTACSSCRASW
jgi:hypothetical protein